MTDYSKLGARCGAAWRENHAGPGYHAIHRIRAVKVLASALGIYMREEDFITSCIHAMNDCCWVCGASENLGTDSNGLVCCAMHEGT